MNTHPSVHPYVLTYLDYIDIIHINKKCLAVKGIPKLKLGILLSLQL